MSYISIQVKNSAPPIPKLKPAALALFLLWSIRKCHLSAEARALQWLRHNFCQFIAPDLTPQTHGINRTLLT